MTALCTCALLQTLSPMTVDGEDSPAAILELTRTVDAGLGSDSDIGTVMRFYELS